MSEYIYETQGEQVIGNPKGFILPKEEIVRCRDCRQFDNHYLKCFRPVLYFDDDYNPHWTDETTFTAVTDAEPDGFCAWAERRSE